MCVCVCVCVCVYVCVCVCVCEGGESEKEREYRVGTKGGVWSGKERTFDLDNDTELYTCICNNSLRIIKC